MIHGNAVSIGCLAMGDSAAEDLFVLAALTGIKNIDVILDNGDAEPPTIELRAPGEPPLGEGLIEPPEVD